MTDVAVPPAEEVSRPSPDEAIPPSPRRAGPPVPKPMAVVLALVLVVGVTVLFFGVFAFGLSGLQQERSQHQLYNQLRGLLAPESTVAPYIGGAIPDGAPVALLNAPAAGMHNVVVVEGTSSGDLLAGPGHLADTPLPGQTGESVLIGKSVTAGASFAGITRLRKGDRLTVRTGQRAFSFTVEGQLAAGATLPKITTAEGLLTLATAGGGTLAPSHLVYVIAKLDGKVAPTPPHQPRTVPASQVQGHNDPSAWPFVVLWVAGLLVASAACWWLWSRWGALRTWLVGAPVLFALLWGLSNEAMRLLPNVY